MADFTVSNGEYLVVEAHSRVYEQLNVARFIYQYNRIDRDGFASTVLDNVRLDILQPLLPMLGPQCKFFKLRAKKYSALGVQEQDFDQQINLVGSALGACLPGNACVVIRKRNNFIGRINKGRWYLSGVPSSALDDGKLSAAARQALQNWSSVLLSAWDTDIDGNGFRVRIATWSASGTIQSSRILTSTYVDDVIRSQRRREIGVGI